MGPTLPNRAQKAAKTWSRGRDLTYHPNPGRTCSRNCVDRDIVVARGGGVSGGHRGEGAASVVPSARLCCRLCRVGVVAGVVVVAGVAGVGTATWGVASTRADTTRVRKRP